MSEYPCACPLCGHTRLRILPNFSEERNGYTKVMCSACLAFFFAPSDAPNVVNAERLS